MIKSYETLYRDFLKGELIEIAQSLGINVGETTSKVLVNKIMADIQENGVPELADCSTIMLEFLVAAEITDIDGNILDEIEGGAQLPEEDEAESDIENAPPCYGFEDERDPSCNKCKVQKQCRSKRMMNRPPCFGKLFEANDENCKVCIEAPFCKLMFAKTMSAKKG